MLEVLFYLSGVCVAGLFMCVYIWVELGEKPNGWDAMVQMEGNDLVGYANETGSSREGGEQLNNNGGEK